MQVSEMLDEAADYLEEHGWCQDTIQDSDGRVCLIGSIRYSRRESPNRQHFPKRAWAILHEATDCKYLDTWNDESGRTEQEVLDALRLAAKTARIEEETCVS